jgi:hypothetical protein
MVPGGSGGSGSVTIVKEAATAAAAVGTKKAVDVTAAKEAMAEKKATEVVTAMDASEVVEVVKKATEEAEVAKPTEEAVAVKKTAEASVAREAIEMEAMKNAIKESMGSGPSPAQGVGSNRDATSGGSTPLSKRFHCAWVPRYVEWFCCFFFLPVFTLFGWNFSLFSAPASGRMPPTDMSGTGSALGAGGAQDVPECHGPKTHQ